MKIGASVSNQAVTRILNTTASADVAYAIDLLSANDKSDLGNGISTTDRKDVAFGTSVNSDTKIFKHCVCGKLRTRNGVSMVQSSINLMKQ